MEAPVTHSSGRPGFSPGLWWGYTSVLAGCFIVLIQDTVGWIYVVDDMLILSELRGQFGPGSTLPMPWFFGLTDLLRWLYRQFPAVTWYSGYLLLLFGYCWAATAEFLARRLPYAPWLSRGLGVLGVFLFYRVFGNSFTFSIVALWGTAISLIWLLHVPSRRAQAAFGLFGLLCIWIRADATLVMVVTQAGILLLLGTAWRRLWVLGLLAALAFVPLAWHYPEHAHNITLGATLFDNCPHQQTTPFYQENPVLMNWLGLHSYGLADPQATDNPALTALVQQCAVSLPEKVHILWANRAAYGEFFRAGVVFLALLVFLFPVRVPNRWRLGFGLLFCLGVILSAVLFAKVVDRLIYPLLFAMFLTVVSTQPPAASPPWLHRLRLALLLMAGVGGLYLGYQRRLRFVAPPSCPATWHHTQAVASLPVAEIYANRRVGDEITLAGLPLQWIQSWPSWAVYHHLRQTGQSFPDWLAAQAASAALLSDPTVVANLNAYLRLAYGRQVVRLDSAQCQALTRRPLWLYQYRVVPVLQPN